MPTELGEMVTLNKVGMDGDGINVLVDFIVYMALEDISFFRFLDFNETPTDPSLNASMGPTPCERFLSWIDFEYLAPKGSRHTRYKSTVKRMLCEGPGKVIANALSAWAKWKPTLTF